MRIRTLLFLACLIAMPYTSWHFFRGNGFGYDATVFSPLEIAELVSQKEDEIAGLCKDGFSKSEGEYHYEEGNYKTKDGLSYQEFCHIFKVKNKHGILQPSEEVRTSSVCPNEIQYLLQDRKKYLRFWEEIINLKASLIPKAENDISHPDDSSFAYNHCIFVKCGFNKDGDAYRIIAFKEDKAIAREVQAYKLNRNLNTIITSLKEYNIVSKETEKVGGGTITMKKGAHMALSLDSGEVVEVYALYDFRIIVPENSVYYLAKNGLVAFVDLKDIHAIFFIHGKAIAVSSFIENRPIQKEVAAYIESLAFNKGN